MEKTTVSVLVLVIACALSLVAGLCSGSFAGYWYGQSRDAEGRIELLKKANESFQVERKNAERAMQELANQANSIATVQLTANQLDRKIKEAGNEFEKMLGCIVPDDVGRLHGDRLKNRNAATQIRGEYDARNKGIGVSKD